MAGAVGQKLLFVKHTRELVGVVSESSGDGDISAVALPEMLVGAFCLLLGMTTMLAMTCCVALVLSPPSKLSNPRFLKGDDHSKHPGPSGRARCMYPRELHCWGFTPRATHTRPGNDGTPCSRVHLNAGFSQFLAPRN